jgi:hypothetical protein
MSTQDSQRKLNVMDQNSDYDDFSGAEGLGPGLNPGLNVTLKDLPNSTLKFLNYATSYVRKWRLDEAFRETYQNW